MGGGPADYLIEILPWPAGTAAAVGQEPIDVTDRATLDDFGSINRAVERDFLSFRTGDVTLGLINDDGELDDLFALFGATERWQLRIFRRGRVIFLGIIVGQGSVTFDRLEKMVEITAYGATKVLDETTAETVKRTIADMTVTTATAGQAQITLNTTAGLLTGDVLHVTDHVNKEDITVKQVTSATVATLEANLQNTYTATSPVVLTTPFYRYKTPDFLVRELFGGVPIAELKISGSLFRRLAPTPVNLQTLNLAAFSWGGFAERNGRAYATLKIQNTANDGTYYQVNPEDSWTKEDATARTWIDWSRYFKQSEAGPDFVIRDFQDELTAGPFLHTGTAPHQGGFTYRNAGTKKHYFACTTHSPNRIESVDATAEDTWGGLATVTTLPVENAVTGDGGRGVEYDPSRNALYVYWFGTSGHFQYYDIAGAAWTDLAQGDDAGMSYYGAVYVPELDAVLALRGASRTGPTFQIAAFRGTARLWVRSFPSCRIARDTGDGNTGYIYPTHTLRYVDGSLYCLAVSDGAVQLIRSDDEFQTFVMRTISESTSKAIYFGSRVLGQYRIFCYSGTASRAYLTAAPFYAGVVSYADFEGKSRAEALQDLAILVNATFWVDDDFQGHFVARDQVPAGDVPDLTERDLLTEQSEIQIWDETRQHAEVSGGGSTATSGDPNFAADGLSIASELIPNEAYAQALADQYVEFYSKRRAMLPVGVIDEEDLQLHPMHRVFVDGRRWYVHESDHSPTEDEWSVKLLEDLENQPAA